MYFLEHRVAEFAREWVAYSPRIRELRDSRKHALLSAKRFAFREMHGPTLSVTLPYTTLRWGKR
jgi:hypothetical protein